MKTRTQQLTTTKTAGGFILLSARMCPLLKVPVDSADMASGQMLGYIRQFNLGGSDLSAKCGNIYSNDGTLVARVSYNGRVWDTQGKLLQDIEDGWPVPENYRNV